MARLSTLASTPFTVHDSAPIYPGRGAPCPACRLRNVHIRVAAVGDAPLGQACPRPGYTTDSTSVPPAQPAHR
jgi:hypothetical protein